MKNDSVSTADISFEVGYKEDKTRFDLNFIAVSTEQEIQQKFNDLADDDSQKAEKEYAICLDALVECSNSPEEGARLREKFAAMNIRHERIVRGAYNIYRNALAPSVDFL